MGARGSVGRFVLSGLLERGVPVRVSARQPRPGQLAPGLDVVQADLTDRASLGPAFEGMGQLFLHANHEGVDGVIETARSAGVSRIVLMSSGSVIHPSSAGNAITEEHREVENAFAGSGLEVVPIRPLVLATNALAWAGPIKAARSVALYQPDALTAPVHERDVAAVAVAALTGNDSATVSELLTGPERITQRHQVRAIAAAIGEDVTVAELPRDQASARFARFMPPAEAEAVLQFLDDAAAGSSPATDTVRRVLGRPATAFDVWAVEHADEF
ncbi:NAD(P)H-binding protein [Microlunatus flavus]|uniref:Uncharacterized conserved protein YbjT, contains NAD(P)-binding and DUF2867 domains n=1 Tax=Microlunatus flavus TaxID=1036181 RepID=A0A1H8ZGL0_9ACTN|nr:NAD(P)H-binding protein [Microlunatus flavus]SEP63546.1 Uncharacterized conserved protein YbjT, contains NAD(P)-binding and DUF2867 domains [Microlunatus flavus]